MKTSSAKIYQPAAMLFRTGLKNAACVIHIVQGSHWSTTLSNIVTSDSTSTHCKKCLF